MKIPRQLVGGFLIYFTNNNVSNLGMLSRLSSSKYSARFTSDKPFLFAALVKSVM